MRTATLGGAQIVRRAGAVLALVLAVYALVQFTTRQPPPSNDTGWYLQGDSMETWLTGYLSGEDVLSTSGFSMYGIDVGSGEPAQLGEHSDWRVSSNDTISNILDSLPAIDVKHPHVAELVGSSRIADRNHRVRTDSVRRAQRDQVLNALDSAAIAFNAPERMKRSDPIGIHLVLDPSLPAGQEARAMSFVEEKAGPVVNARIGIGTVMRARLVGPSFKIDTVTPTQQNIGNATRTDWRWIVVPNERGKHRLDLTLDAVLDGETSPFAIGTFSRTIEVEVSAPVRLLGWLNDQLEWIGPALLSACIGMVAWLSGRHHGRQNPPGVPAETRNDRPLTVADGSNRSAHPNPRSKGEKHKRGGKRPRRHGRS